MIKQLNDKHGAMKDRNKLKSIIVYDPKNVFFRLLKIKFSSLAKFNWIKTIDKINDEFREKSLVAVVVVYTHEDLLALMKLNNYGLPILLLSFDENMLNLADEVSNVYTISLNNTKQNIFVLFEDYLKLF